MVIAALLVFATLLIAWIVAPAERHGADPSSAALEEGALPQAA